MKTKSILSLALFAAFVTPAVADQKTPVPAPVPNAAATIKQIEAQFGFVPAFIRAMPQALLPSWWDGMTQFQMNPNTKLDGKTKELLGIAVAAAIPCEYCIYFHTEAAKLNGATEQEIAEAVAMSAMTREGSTLLNGMQVDKAQFKRDVDKIVATVKAQKVPKAARK